MLKNYEISTFKSFKNKTKFDLEKTNYQMLSDVNVKDTILKGAMFVGANASGKSNAILAIKFLLDGLLGKSDINFKQYMCLFSEDYSIELKYSFVIDNAEIQYNISFQRIDQLYN